jgi:hypothetical protein
MQDQAASFHLTAQQQESAQDVLNLLRGQLISPAMTESAERALLVQPQVACPVYHHFGPNLYFREVHMPADTFAIGHHQNFDQWNFFLKGRITAILDDGSLQELVAPMSFLGAAGRKIGYVHEDVVWINVYATSLTDVGQLEALLLTKSDSWQMDAATRQALAGLRHQEDRDDFAAAIAELGYTAEQVRAQSENEDDQIPLPPGMQRVKVGASPIEGLGLFATADIAAGDLIAMGRINGKRTPAGRYTNHARHPNARMQVINSRGDIALFALRALRGCHGGADGEEITVDYRQANQEVTQFHQRNQ